MARLEELTPATLVKGIIPDAMVEIVSAKWHGDVLEIVYKDSAGRVGMELLYRDKESSLQIVTAGRHYSFDGDGKMFRLVSEAHRIRLAYLFDPHVAVNTSLVQPLPTRSRPSMKPCCLGSRFDTFSRTTPARARPSWRVCSSRNS